MVISTKMNQKMNQIIFRETCMMLLFRVSVQLNVPTWSATPSTLEQLQVYFYSITGPIQLDCFDKSVYSQCALCMPHGLQLPARLSNCKFTFIQLPGLSNLIVSISQFTLNVHYACNKTWIKFMKAFCLF